MSAKALLAVLALAPLGRAQDIGREVRFGSASGVVLAMPAAGAGAVQETGPSTAVAESWDTVLVQGQLPDPNVRLQASRSAAGPWVDLAVKRSADGRFWGRAALGPGTGAVRLRAVGSGSSLAHEVSLYAVEVFESGPEAPPSAPVPPPAGPGDPTAQPPAFKTRADWGAAAPSEPYSPDPLPWRVTLHHTDGKYPATEAESVAEVRFVQDFHINGRGWSDIGYHFLIDPAGRIFEGRPLGALGAHTLANNEGNVGICFLGTYHSPKNHLPTAAQLDAASLLGRYLVKRFGIEPGSLKGHRDYRQTDCPGTKLYPKLDELRRGFAGLRVTKRPVTSKAARRPALLAVPALPDFDGRALVPGR